jgi:OOP family OmpA-OmpF porin
VRLRGASLCVRMLVVTAAVACGGPAKAPPVAPERPAAPVAPVDTDGDGIVDAEDACPKEPGVASSDPMKRGCPAPKVVVAESVGAVIVTRVHFPRRASALPSETFRLIDATIVVMKSKPEIRQVAVEGHASSDEPDAQGLSEARANAVLDRMVAAGIDRTRLVARGYGSSQPVADGKTADGRAQNRRVDFKVLDDASSSSSSAGSQACSMPASPRP